MPKNKYRAVLSDGTVITRNTDRTYTHVVVYRAGLAELLDLAHHKGWTTTERSNYAYYLKQVANGATTHNPVIEGEPAWRTESRARDLAIALAATAPYPTVEDYLAHWLAGRIERAHAQQGKWHVAGWCGRHDLALKLAIKNHPCADKVDILPVQ